MRGAKVPIELAALLTHPAAKTTNWPSKATDYPLLGELRKPCSEDEIESTENNLEAVFKAQIAEVADHGFVDHWKTESV